MPFTAMYFPILERLAQISVVDVIVIETSQACAGNRDLKFTCQLKRLFSQCFHFHW
jgi:hypothetical protein